MAVQPEEVNFKEKYRSLKRKMRFLIYEQECFQEELRRAQRKLLKISRDKNFLLDRLLQYERVIDPGTDSDSTLSSEDSCKETKKEQEKKVVKKKRRAKKKPTKKLMGTPVLGASRDPLPHDLRTLPPSLHQQLPHLAELIRKASEGLPITHQPGMQMPGMPTTGPDQQQQQHQPPLQSPLSLLSPHHQLPHPALLSPTVGMGLPLANMAHVFDPRAFDRSMQHHHLPPQPSPYSLPGLLGMGLGGGPMGLGGEMPHMDLNALTAAAAQDKVNQERSKKKSKKDTSDKHSSGSQGPSTSHHRIPLPQPSTSSTHDDNEDLVIDVRDSKI
ncbi:INO80 complex subunit E isoform X2 [Strongylocentrotus purpuratus]|nr:INO80 complex subunit E isoform X2 [Strongylocentrotus purpuratus]XP_030848227.1 INO80 complex subunit E isoform X2 [Strongylocentrotus purpuratus]